MYLYSDALVRLVLGEIVFSVISRLSLGATHLSIFRKLLLLFVCNERFVVARCVN